MKPKVHGSRLIGVDISSNAVKVLELSRQKEGYRVESYGVSPLESDAVIEHDIKNIEAVSDAVNLAIKRSRTKVKYAAVAMPGSAVITKIIPMDVNLNEDDLEAQIRLEASRFIPFPLNEVSLDFEVQGPAEQAAGMQNVLLAATRTESMETRVDSVESSGLNVSVVDVESYAMERACALILEQLPGSGADKTILIVDIGASMTTLTVLNNLTTVYVREELYGGKQLTEAIQQHYGMSFEEAGRAKKFGGLDDSYETQILEPFKQALVPLIQRSLQFFYSATPFDHVDHIVLAGGTARIPGLAELVQEKVEISCCIANPFEAMEHAPEVNKEALHSDAPAMMMCCGLALRSFD